MNADDIARLERLMSEHGIAELQVDEGDLHIHLGARARPVRPMAVPSADADASLEVKATAFGHFRLTQSDGLPRPEFPLTARAGDVVGWLEAKGLMFPILAPANGTLARPLVPEGTLVGYGTRLF